MIAQDEYISWRKHPITVELLKLLAVGRQTALEDLVNGRGTDGDFCRGALSQTDELIHIISTGDELIKEV